FIKMDVTESIMVFPGCEPPIFIRLIIIARNAGGPDQSTEFICDQYFRYFNITSSPIDPFKLQP
ncbi:MAG: hypothetical protein ACE5D7_11565, partial [Fidelibacterota bacterium]